MQQLILAMSWTALVLAYLDMSGFFETVEAPMGQRINFRQASYYMSHLNSALPWTVVAEVLDDNF